MKSVNLFKTLLIASFVMAASSLSLNSVAAEKREQTYVKTGSFTAAKTTIPIGDVPGHELVQETSKWNIKYSDPSFKTKEEWDYVDSDLVDGNGKQTGYFVDIHEDGSTSYGNFEGTMTTKVQNDGAWESTWEGTYKYVGGSGKYKNIKGSGTYKGRMSSKEAAREEGKETVEY
jgi:hypothetical protein